jgi:hypothetical protein
MNQGFGVLLETARSGTRKMSPFLLADAKTWLPLWQCQAYFEMSE